MLGYKSVITYKKVTNYILWLKDSHKAIN